MNQLFDFLLFASGIFATLAILAYAGRAENNTPHPDDYDGDDDL